MSILILEKKQNAPNIQISCLKILVLVIMEEILKILFHYNFMHLFNIFSEKCLAIF